MKIQDFANRFPEKMRKVTDFIKGDDIKEIIGVEATNHYKKSFHNEGFTALVHVLFYYEISSFTTFQKEQKTPIYPMV